MNKQTRILGISGSLRRESCNGAALRAAAGLAPKARLSKRSSSTAYPPFNQDEERNPPAPKSWS